LHQFTNNPFEMRQRLVGPSWHIPVLLALRVAWSPFIDIRRCRSSLTRASASSFNGSVAAFQ